METNLQSENANLRFENAKLKFETLFNERPSTIRSFAFHSGLRIFYLIAGWVGLVGSLIYFGIMLTISFLNQQLTENLQDDNNINNYVANKIADALLPTNIVMSLVLLTLSICLLIMARLCRKIVRRNMYIMDLENIWMDVKK